MTDAPFKPTRVTQQQTVEAPAKHLVLDETFIGTFVAGDTTPSVLNVEYFKASGTATNITWFKNGQNSQRIHVKGDGKTVVIHNPTKIASNNGASKLLLNNQVYVYTLIDGVWCEDALPQVPPNLVTAHTHDAGDIISGMLGEDRLVGRYQYITGVGALDSGSIVAGFGGAILTELTVDSPTLFVDKVNHRVGIGTLAPSMPLHISADGLPVNAALLTSDYVLLSKEASAAGVTIVIASNINAGDRGVFKAIRARGTLAIPLVPNAGDNVFTLLGAIYDGVATQATAGIFFNVDGTVSAGVAPQSIDLVTSATSAGARVTRWSVKSTGHLFAGINDTYDIGDSTHAPRTMYVGTSILPDTNNGAVIGIASLGFMTLRIEHTVNQATGIELAQVAAATSSPRIMFGNITSANWIGHGVTIYHNGIDRLSFTTGSTPGVASGTTRWSYDTGALYPETDNAYDLGYNSTNRWRSIYLGTSVYTAIVESLGSTLSLKISGNTIFDIAVSNVTLYKDFIMNRIGAIDTQMSITRSAGQYGNIWFQTDSVNRWRISINNVAEPGADVGSDMEFIARHDDGTYSGTVLYLWRKTLAATFGGQISAPSGTFTTRVTSPLIGTITDVDTVFDRNTIVKLTLAASLATFTTQVGIPATDGSTINLFGAVSNFQLLQRVGNTIVGVDPYRPSTITFPANTFVTRITIQDFKVTYLSTIVGLTISRYMDSSLAPTSEHFYRANVDLNSIRNGSFDILIMCSDAQGQPTSNPSEESLTVNYQLF